jgi:GNAT superfamily N-acetyltransferase
VHPRVSLWQALRVPVLDPSMLSPVQRRQVGTILTASFRPEHHVELEKLLGPDRRVYVRVDDVGEVLGFATTQLLAPLGVHYLGYLAVAPAGRDQGVGTSLLRHVLERARVDGAGAVVLEVEDPAAATGEDDRVQRERRLAFYTRAGAVRLPLAWRTPFADRSGTEPMYLLWVPVSAPPPEGRALLDLATGLYTLHYGVAADDPLVTRVLGSVDRA